MVSAALPTNRFTTLLDRVEMFYAVFSLTFFSGGFGVGADTYLHLDGLLPGSVITALRYGVWVGSGVLLGVHYQAAIVTFLRSPVLWLFVLVLLFSEGWSIYPQYTQSNSREIWQMAMFGLYFAARFTLREQVQLIAITFGVGGLFSTFFALLMPSVAIHADMHSGAWRGIYDYKNTLASMMVMGALAVLLMPIHPTRSAGLRPIGFLFCLVLMLMSTSKSGLVLSFVLVGWLMFYRNFRWNGKISVVLMNLGLLVTGWSVTFLFSNWVALLTGLGKDPTLTGRTKIWSVGWASLGDRVWFGFGRGGFWAPESPMAVKAGLLLSETYVPPHAHNGFLDLILDVGIVGFGLFALCLAITYVKALRRAYASVRSEDYWPLIFLSFLVLNNVTESYLFRLSNLYGTLFIATALMPPAQPSNLLAAKLNE